MCYEPELDPIFDDFERFYNWTSKHEIRIEPDTIFKDGDADRAVCSCGWKGPGRNYPQDAALDGEKHRRQMKEDLDESDVT